MKREQFPFHNDQAKAKRTMSYKARLSLVVYAAQKAVTESNFPYGKQAAKWSV